MSTNRILRPRSGSIDARLPVVAKPIVVLNKPTEGQTTATSGAAGTSGVGTATAVKAPQQSMERFVERLENELSLLRAQLMEQAEQFRKDIALMQEYHRKEVMHLREENRKERLEREKVSGLLEQLVATQSQQQQQLLPQQRAGAATSTVVSSPDQDQEGGSWAEVVRRKPARQQATQRQQQRLQEVQPRTNQPSYRVAGQHQQQWQLRGQLLRNQRQQQPRTTMTAAAKKARKRPDTIVVTPAEGISFSNMYKTIRRSPLLDGLQEKIGVGRRTPKDIMRLPLSRDVDSAELCQRIRVNIGENGVAIVRTEMAQVMVTNIDSLADEDQLRQAMLTAQGKEQVEATIDMWERRDGTKRARVTLPRSEAEYLAGKRLILGYTSCCVWEVPKASLAEKRCFRCLERGHFAGQCSGEDRSKVCIRCGVEGHKAVTCIGKVRCLKCGGPHPIASASCNATAQQ
uniref:CCHC-type domain-containing protein n=1 Tax=Anopheles merus TaxID=30066 RepID=A0A182V5Y4_ANOME